MNPNSSLPLPGDYRISETTSEGSSGHTVRPHFHQRALSDSGMNGTRSNTAPTVDPDIVMRDGHAATASQQPSNTGGRWFDNLDARVDNPTGYHTTVHAPSSGMPSSLRQTRTADPQLAPLPSLQAISISHDQGSAAPQAAPTQFSFVPSEIRRGASERGGPSGANGVNILDPVHAPRASSDPGQETSHQRSNAGNIQAGNGNNAQITEDQRQSSDESSDDEPPPGSGGRYNIPPNHFFRHGESRDNRAGVWHPAPQNATPGPSAPPSTLPDHRIPAPTQQTHYHPTNGYGPPAQQNHQHLGPDNQSQTYVTMDQFTALQQCLNQGFQSLASILTAQRPMTLCERQPRTRSSRKFTPLPPKLHDLIEHRDPPLNAFHSSIRKHFDKLLGDDPLKITVRPEESTAYTTIWLPSKGRRCRPSTTIEAFRIDIAGLPRGPWNRSATAVFATDYARCHGENTPVGSARWNEIQKQALSRCESLKAAFRRKELGDQDAEVEGKTRRSTGRRAERFRRRLKGALHFNVAPEHVHMLQVLGPNGMSSDESDWYQPDGGPSDERCPRYWIHRPKWRSHAVITSWLRIFDSLYQMYRNSKTDRRGARIWQRGDKHPRHEYSKSDKYVSGLPINAYDEQWMADPETLKELVRLQAPFLFQHHPDILEKVRRARPRTEYN